MEGSQGWRKPLVVPRQSPEACRPGKASLHDPSSRQQDEATFSLSMFDYLQLNPVLRRRLCRGFARISLIDIGACQRV